MKLTRLVLPSLLVAAAAFAGPAAAADLTGMWKLTAKVETFGFVLHCKFDQAGEKLTGVCTDMSTNDPQHKPQGSHTLTSGAVVGDKVRFTYKTHFLLIPFTCSYSGVLSAEGISGEAEAPGHKGVFTAVRL